MSHALGLLQSGEEKIAASRQLLTGELIIGASDTVTKTYLVSRLEAFHKAYPDIRIRILNGTTSMVLDYLHAGQVDIAFASEAPDETVYSVRHCVDTHTIFVAAPDYLEFDKVYTMEEIAALPLILLERKASSRVYVERYFQEHGLSIQPEIELGSHNLLISLARIGLGVACVTEEFSLSGLERGVIGATVDLMKSKGADPANIVATLGPRICGDCYEVGDEIADQFIKRFPLTKTKTRFGGAGIDIAEAAMIDLAFAGVHQVVDSMPRVHAATQYLEEDPELAELCRTDGEGPAELAERIDNISHSMCTLENPLWYSHRRAALANKTHEGRLLALIVRD